MKPGTQPERRFGNTSADKSEVSGLEAITQSFSNLTERLESRTKVDPNIFAEVMLLREQSHLKGNNTKLLANELILPQAYFEQFSMLSLIPFSMTIVTL